MPPKGPQTVVELSISFSRPNTRPLLPASSSRGKVAAHASISTTCRALRSPPKTDLSPLPFLSGCRRKSLDLCMIRMTNCLELGGFGMAKAVCRRVEVLHLSEDGATALLGVAIKEEDKRVLDMGDEGREWCKSVHVFNFRLDETAPESERKYLREQAGTCAEANGADNDKSSVRSTGGVGGAFVDLESIFFSMAEYATNFKIVVGPSQEQSRNLRHMVFSKLSLGESFASPFIPITNIRMGEWKEGSETTMVDGCIRSKDMAWQGWFLPGDDRQSQKFPWQFVAADRTGNSRDKAKAATAGENFLSCFFSRDHASHSSGTGVAVQFVQFSQTGPIVSTRRMGKAEEGRPLYSDTPKMALFGEWDGMDVDIPHIEKMFREWKTAPTFYDVKEMIRLTGNTT
jgi:hypothetical protein